MIRRRPQPAPGPWQQPWPGVHADAGSELDAVQRASGRTAARVPGLVLLDDHDPATGQHEQDLDEVLVWSPRRFLTQVLPDGTVRTLRRRQLRPHPSDLVRLDSGLWVTSVLRTVVDCAGLLQPDALVCLLDDALHRGLLSRAGLAAALASRAWCAGAVALRTSVGLADARAESPAETLLRLTVLPSLPDLVPQVCVRDRSGRVVARLDLADAALRLALEADGRRGHAGEAMVAEDRRRDRTTQALGWRTVRSTWFDLRCRRSEVRSVAVRAAEEQARRGLITRS